MSRIADNNGTALSSARLASSIASGWTRNLVQGNEPWPIYVLQAGVTLVFLLVSLLLPQQTSLAPSVLVLTVALWVAASLGRRIWLRRRGLDAGGLLNPTALFLGVVSATFTIQALDLAANPGAAVYSPGAPEALPGLATKITPYYLVLHSVVVLAAVWYAHARERQVEAGLAILFVYTSFLFERVLRLGPGLPLLWGPLLVLLAQRITYARSDGRSWWSLPGFSRPVLALLAAGAITTITSVYVYASLTMLGRVAAFALLFWLMAGVTAGWRQVRLFWLALVAPMVGAALLIDLKLIDVGQALGWNYAFSLRYEVLGVAGPNPIGLGLAVAILLVVGAIMVQQGWRAKALLGALVIVMFPAFLAPHSPGSLGAFAGALGGLAVLRYGLHVVRPGPLALMRMAVAGGAVVVAAAAVFFFIFVQNPYSGKIIGDVTDPTAGGAMRKFVWSQSGRDISHHPLVGVGLGDYYARTQYVPDFPTRDITRVAERRLLLGGDGEQWKIYVRGHPHNFALAIIETMGVFGAAALLWLMLSLSTAAWRLFRQADGSHDWWAAAVPGAGLAMVLVWNLFSQGEDITILALPLWPLLGLLAARMRLVGEPEGGRSESSWARPWLDMAARPLDRVRTLRLSPRMASATIAAAIGLAFLGLVARPALAETYAAQGHIHLSHSEFAKAIDRLGIAHRLDPWNATYVLDLSQAHVFVGNIDQGVREAERFVELQDQRASNHTWLGWMYWYSGDPDAALREFDRSVELDPWNTLQSGNYVGKGLAELFLGRREDAINTLARGLYMSPATIENKVWAPLPTGGRAIDPAFGPDGDGERRLAFIRQFLFVSQTNPPPTFDPSPLPLGDVTAVMHQQALAELSSNRDQGEEMLLSLARIYSSADLPEASRDVLLELRELQPDTSYVYYNLGLEYRALGDFEAAEAAFKRTVDLAKSSSTYDLYEPFGYLELGKLYVAFNQEQQALEPLRLALSTYRWAYLPDVYESLAIAERQAGDRDHVADLNARIEFLLGRRNE